MISDQLLNIIVISGIFDCSLPVLHIGANKVLGFQLAHRKPNLI